MKLGDMKYILPNIIVINNSKKELLKINQSGEVEVQDTSDMNEATKIFFSQLENAIQIMIINNFMKTENGLERKQK